MHLHPIKINDTAIVIVKNFLQNGGGTTIRANTNTVIYQNMARYQVEFKAVRKKYNKFS